MNNDNNDNNDDNDNNDNNDTQNFIGYLESYNLKDNKKDYQ